MRTMVPNSPQGKELSMLPKKDYSMNDPRVFRAVAHPTKHDHLDDPAPKPTWQQNLLLAIGVMVVCIGLGQFLAWGESHGNAALLISVLLLAGLLLWDRLRFVTKRAICQICFPSGNRGW